jgi:RimJ/RimL family protein N-acetyltransferase
MSPAGGIASSEEVIQIRPYNIADAQDLWVAARESFNELNPWMPWCHVNYDMQESRTWMDQQVKEFDARTAFEFAILADDRYVGGIGLNQIDKANRRANLGYWVRTSSTRRGIATEAVQQLFQWALENTDLYRVEIVIGVGNVASQRVAEKAGATREGVLRGRLILHNVAHDAVMFSLTRPLRATSGANGS